MPCSPACFDSEATIVARNSNSYQENDGGQIEDLTCTGGFQAYCCTGFVPLSITNSGNLVLYGQTCALSKRGGSNTGLSLYVRGYGLEERGLSGLILSGLGLGPLYLANVVPSLLRALPTLGLSLIMEGAVCALAALTGAAATIYVGWRIISGIVRWPVGRGSGSGQHFIDASGSPNFTR